MNTPHTAFARAQHLKRGINVSHWFSQNAPDYSAQHTDTETTPGDIATIASFLASDDAGWVNGQTIQAAGGNRL